MKVFPHHKLNLGLNVVLRRPDGYHDIETLFVPCDAYSDELEIVEAPSFSADLGDCDWPIEKDLAVRAYLILKDEFDLPPVRLNMRKGIPYGAGLGGGSSDAAAVLKLCNSLFSLGLTDAQLASRARTLGADCPFFIYNRPLFATGIGDEFKEFALDLSGFRFEVVMPEGVHIGTAEAYSALQPHRADPPLEEALRHPVPEWKGCVFNDFELPAFRKYPLLAEIKKDFYDRGALYSAMSGSGAAIFGMFAK
ncbi:MAG: 4-(cytidine 5'-diphospho)-2-C-methyl-D-erythritol kinase [Bacteroidales bacterium]|nr:4-(cytidine 5'-diphospho)-2-C-methyl-D-erythritol kinase [Bacteroidales bacterium]